MPFFNRLIAVVLTVVLIAPAVLLEAKTRKGDKYFAEGQKAESKKDWDGALENYDKALLEDPSEIVYQIAAEKARAEASQSHVDKGLRLRNMGQLGEALLEFQRAFGINPASTAAEQEIRVTQAMIQRERQRVQETGKASAPDVRALTPAEEERKRIDDRIDRMLPVPELRPLDPKPINLKMNNQSPRVLFETVAKVAGINVIWDPEYQPGRPLSVDLNNTTLEQALDYLSVLTKSFWQPLSSNTIFIANDSRNKRQDYEQQVLKVFYLRNVSTPQELQEIVNAVRAVTELTRLMPYNSQNAIIARGESDRVALAEKIIHDLDKPRPEVVIDVMVLQASQIFTRKITAAIASTGLNVPVNFNPRASLQVTQSNTTNSSTNSSSTNNSTNVNSTFNSNTSSTATANGPFAIPLSNLSHLSSADYSITLPGALLQAALSDANTKILQAPQVRSVNNQKASIKIGDRIPTASGSYQPGIGGVGINPLVNTQFTYLDVGVNVDIVPVVNNDTEVSMHVDLDISSEAGTVNLGGIEEPIIQQNKVSHDLRVREGEVSLLAGLMQQQETKTVTGIPGLSSIPLIRRLFSGEEVDRNKSELMIALIPHIIRRPEIEPSNIREISVGSQNTIKLNYAPRAVETAPAPAGAPGPAPAVVPPPPAPAPGAAAAQPAAPGNAAPNPAPAPPPVQALPPAGSTRVFFQPSQVDTTLGASITVGLNVEGAADLASAPMQIRFDPRILRLNSISLGDFLTQGGQQPAFTQNVQNDSGTATIQLSRLPGTPGVSGSGGLINLSFQAVGRGSTTVSIPNLTLGNSQGQPSTVANPQLTVNVR